jgi:hypothetical protein
MGMLWYDIINNYKNKRSLKYRRDIAKRELRQKYLTSITLKVLEWYIHLYLDTKLSLVKLATHNRVQLIWVPDHEGIEGNETANQLAKLGSECPFTKPEPACGSSAGINKKAVRDWTNRDHKKYWESLIGLRQAKGFLKGPSVKRTKKLLKLNRYQLRWVTGLLTGHCHPKGHLFKKGLTNSPICERCLEKDESATHILCDREAIAYLDFVTWAITLCNQVTTKTPL